MPFFVLEMSRESLHRLSLGFAEIGESVLDLLELLDIGEKPVGTDKVLVHIVKVPENHISPEDELVQRLGRIVDRLVALV